MLFQVLGADAGLLPPGVLRDVAFHGFVVPAERAALRRLLHRAFAEVSDGAVRVEPMGQHVVLLHTHIPRLQSGQPARGWLRYSDVALWVPARLNREPVFFPVYIFVDHPHTMVTGRETYGLPKEMGWFHMPEDGPGPLTVDVWGTDAPHAEIRRRRLWSIERPDAGSLALPLQAALEPARWIPNRVIGVQQLRDPEVPARAIHQAIVTGAIRTTRIHETIFHPGEHRLDLRELASHPVARDTGLRLGEQPVRAAFTVRADVEMDAGRVEWRAEAPRRGARPASPRRKVAVLGGGIAALTAAMELTEPGSNVDVTVYTRGWRLGGKGASGRNADADQRIEEHGLHVWYGFYDNAFRLMRRVFAELDRGPSHPLGSFEQAFLPQRSVTLCEERGDAWKRWRVEFPDTPQEPGVGEIGSPLGARFMVDWLRELLEMAIADGLLDGRVRARRAGRRRRTWAALPAALSLEALRRLALAAPTGGDPRAHLNRLRAGLERFRAALWPMVEERLEVDALRRLFTVADMITTCLAGLLDDDLFSAGLDSVNGEDLRAWMRRHGAKDVTLGAPIVRFIYNAGFSFAGGDASAPAFAAGAGLRGVLRLMLTYKGAILYKMNGGMGDVIFAPLYELLRRRGVRFRFFHSVEELELDGAGERVDGVRLVRQCEAPGYEPLVSIHGVPCWPSEPRWDQIVDGEAIAARLAESGQHLEQVAVAPGTAGPAVHLRRGKDFDDVVLAIPTAAQRGPCRQLMMADRRFRKMVEGVPTVATQSYQLWLRTDLAGLGWDTPDPIVGTFRDPVDTWSDMSYLLPLEHHPEAVRHLAYFCGVIDEPDDESDAEAQARIRARAAAYLRDELPALWPGWAGPEGIRWDLLHDPADREGAARLDAQLVKINRRGSDRYTQSLPGTMDVRLKAHESGFDNLYLAGDWTDNGFNCGCIEATVMSGMQAARAAGGRDLEVIGETEAWLCAVFGVPWNGANRYVPPAREVAEVEQRVTAA